MPTEVIMPSLGAASDELKLVRWLVKKGDTVEKGQPIFEAESDKSVVEVEAPDSGTLGKFLASPEDIVLAGEVVAILLAPGEKLPAETETPSPTTNSIPATSFLSMPELPLSSSKTVQPSDRIIASPLARKMARKEGIDLNTIKGTGPGGRIIKADIEDALERLATAPTLIQPSGPIASLPLTGTRGVIARHMSESVHTTAPVTLTTEADAGSLVRLRQMLKTEAGKRGDVISYDLLMAMITAQALQRHPNLNASLTPAGIVQHEQINIGVAVDTERGLLVPVLKAVPTRSMLDLATDLQAKVAKAQAGKAAPEDLSGGTFTITNLGLFGIDAFTPIINLPECAILGIGCIREKPVARQGQLVLGQMMALSLTFDHRIVDGAPAARFLQEVTRLVEKPELILLCYW
jgi:pyruvate dehydrogenase E2 component (dihydrolipoamide acetyltransferase)